MVGEVVIAPCSIELGKDTIVNGFCLKIFGNFFPSDQNSLQGNAFREVPSSRVLAKRGQDLLSKNPMIPMKGTPSAFLMSFHGVSDANGEVPCSPRAFVVPKLVWKGLMPDVKCTHVAFVITFGDKPSSSRIKGQRLMLEGPYGSLSFLLLILSHIP